MGIDTKHASIFQYTSPYPKSKSAVYPQRVDGTLMMLQVGNLSYRGCSRRLTVPVDMVKTSVTLIQRSAEYRADEITVKKVLSHPKMHAVTNTELIEIKGDKFVKSITYLDKNTGKNVELPVAGIFVEIGSLPNTDFLKDVVDLSPTGHVVTDPRNQKTSVPGIWAAGDVTDGLYHQNNIAVGDAVKAVEDIYLFLHKK